MSGMDATYDQFCTTWGPSGTVLGAGDDAKRLRAMECSFVAQSYAVLCPPPPFDELRPDVGNALASRWGTPCEAAYEFLAQRYPDQLLLWLRRGSLAPADVTFAAEVAGRIPHSSAVRSALVPLLQHQQAVVREGAIYGLGRHLDDQVRSLLASMAEHDTSEGVRIAAAEALEQP